MCKLVCVRSWGYTSTPSHTMPYWSARPFLRFASLVAFPPPGSPPSHFRRVLGLECCEALKRSTVNIHNKSWPPISDGNGERTNHNLRAVNPTVAILAFLWMLAQASINNRSRKKKYKHVIHHSDNIRIKEIKDNEVLNPENRGHPTIQLAMWTWGKSARSLN